MTFSLADIKLFQTVDLDNFSIRGAKTGINNSRSTSPLYVDGTFVRPMKSLTYGSVTTGTDTTITGIDATGWYALGVTALDLVEGDIITAGAEDLKIIQPLTATSAVVEEIPQSAMTYSDATYSLGDRDYLIEPDVGSNTVYQGLARFTNGSKQVDGTGTTWLADLTSGDAIQLNTYQKYFIVDQCISDTSCTLKEAFDDPTNPTGFNAYTAKRWRLDRLMYQYVKNDFEYDKNGGRWTYDSTTGGDRTAYSYYDPFVDGISLKFTPTLKPSTYPDFMDSNVALLKTLSRSTVNEAYQFSLPAVPMPEESFKLYLNNVLKTNGVDYVINYSQMPTYEYPPPPEERTVANLMFLKGIQDSTLSILATQTGILAFTDQSGNSLQGIMPGTEIIRIDGTDQTANQDYVLDLDSGVGYASEVITDEPVVKYVMYQRKNLYDLGINITKDGVPQKLTIPGEPSDDVIFDIESGRLKPATQNNPGPGEQYVVEYYSEGEYVSDEIIKITGTVDYVRVSTYPIKFQSVILSKNGVYLDDGIDFRISYLTGRIVFFSSLVLGDTIDVSYSPLIKHTDALTYEYGENFTTVISRETSVSSVTPIGFVFPNQDLVSNTDLSITGIYNQTKSLAYDTTGYIIKGYNVEVVSNAYNLSIGTATSDVIEITYKFPNDGVENIPVQTINFSINQDTNYMALVNQDATSLFPSGTFVRLTNVDTAGDFFFKDASSVYDGEDTVVYFTGSSPLDIINPTIYILDASNVSFDLVPLTASPIISGTTEIKFPGANVSRAFRAGQLLNIGDDYYSIVGSDYTNSSNVVAINVESFQDYTSSTVLQNIYKADYPIYNEYDTVVSTKNDIITDPAVPVMTLNCPSYAVVTKDSSSLSVDVGTSHYTFLDSAYPTVDLLQAGLDTTAGIDATLYSNAWYTTKLNLFSGAVVTADSNTLVTGFEALRLNGVDTTNFTVSGGTLTISPIAPGQRYNFDYLGQRFLDDSTVVFSGRYFTTLPAKTNVKVSMNYNNLDQFYVQVMSQRDFLDYVIQPRRQEEAAQQNGNVGQGGDLPGDEDSGKSEGGLTNLEYSRMDQVIECAVFDKIFDFFNGRAQSYSDEMYALKGWKLCNNDGLLSETDQSSGALSVNRMFPWTNYTDFPPYKIACLTGQATPYVVAPGTKKPGKDSPCKAYFNGTDVTCITAPNGFPSYWTYQLRVNDYIRPYDTTVNYKIASIINDSHLTLSTSYTGTSIAKPFVMVSNFPLYDDDGYTGPKVDGTVSEDFGLINGDVFDVQVDGSDQSYAFQSSINPPLSGYNAADVAKYLSAALGINVSVGWYFDPDSEYGYSTGLIVRADGTHNKMIIKHGPAVSKLGFAVDSTTYGNNDGTHSNPEFVYLNGELTDINTQLAAINNSLGISNKMARPVLDATTVRTMCADETVQINFEMQLLNREISSLSHLLQEPSMPGNSSNLAAYTTTLQFQADSSVALAYDQSVAYDYQGLINPQGWLVNLQSRDTTVVHGKTATDIVPVYSGIDVTSIIGQTVFNVRVEATAHDRRILDGTVDAVYYPPTVKYQDSSSDVSGYWAGFANGYSTSQDATFNFNSIPVFYLVQTDTTVFSYSIDTTGLNLSWDGTNQSFLYTSYSIINSLKAAINGIYGIDATGDSIHDSSNPKGLKITGLTVISPDATVYSGLRENFVDYHTIDDKNLNDRKAFDLVRITQLNDRLDYLDDREDQIRANMLAEETFMSSDASSIGNLYEWADNRFNRSVGCEARLKQIEKQIQMNNSGLTVSRRFF